MPKTRDVRPEFREFNKIFESLSYRHDSNTLFSDYLDFFINYFSFNHRIDLEHMKKVYKLEERHKFHQLIMESIKVMDKMIVDDKSWYDLFGHYYEILASNSKKSSFGQFFTPETLCTMLALIINPQNGDKMNEPTCGSGRMNLAVHVNSPGVFHVAQDMDYMCVRMTALNFMMHGVDGIVICMNTLTMLPDSFVGAFRVNRWLKYTGVPQIEYIGDVNEAYSYIMKKKKIEVEPEPTKEEIKEVIEELNVNAKTNQISLF